MGCASSSPLVTNGGGPGGLVESAKTTATEVMSSGENAMNEMGEKLTEGVGQMKETMVETVNGIGDVINDGMTKIPLNDDTNHLLEENLENLKNEMLNKTQSIGDEADKITDELIKDTEDVIRDAETGMVDVKNNAVDTMESMKNDFMEQMNLSSPSHSIETIKTSVPEPEIERIMNGDDSLVSPEATMNELENLQMEPNEEKAADESSMEAKADEPMPEPMPPMKVEDELVVEDIKDENPPMVERPIGKLQKSVAIQESEEESFEEESLSDSKEVPPQPERTTWEELQDINFKNRFQRARNASEESLMDDEDACTINLSTMYDEHQIQPSEKLTSLSEVLTKQDTLEVIDELIKIFEDDNGEVKDESRKNFEDNVGEIKDELKNTFEDDKDEVKDELVGDENGDVLNEALKICEEENSELKDESPKTFEDKNSEVTNEAPEIILD